jgi:hypothetical protein
MQIQSGWKMGGQGRGKRAVPPKKKARLRQARRLLIVPFKTKFFLYIYTINELVIPDADDSCICLTLGTQQHISIKI